MIDFTDFDKDINHKRIPIALFGRFELFPQGKEEYERGLLHGIDYTKEKAHELIKIEKLKIPRYLVEAIDSYRIIILETDEDIEEMLEDFGIEYSSIDYDLVRAYVNPLTRQFVEVEE